VTVAPVRRRAAASPAVRFPAEWEPHEATWLAWPHDPITFPDLPPVERLWAEMIAHLTRGESVHLLLRDDAEEARARKVLGRRHDPKRLFLHRHATVDVWIRDYGPLFVRTRGGLRILDWRFNAWGNKYPPLAADDRMPEFAAEGLGLPLDKVDVVLEGGSVEFDGAGTLLTTEGCLLHPNRNPGLGREEVEGALRRWFGVRRVIWLGRGIEGDDTDGHIDDIARFVAPRTVVACVEPDPADPNHAILEDNLARLRKAKDARGRSLRVIPLPMPAPLEEENPVKGHEALRAPASYANFYIGNAAVLVPVFGQRRRDAEALRILRGLFPKRKVVGLDCRALVGGNGAIHCVTQQQPRG
jgi:agmatine deiminase